MTEHTPPQITWLFGPMLDVAKEAKSLGLWVSHFNSGSRFNESNGTRFFRSPDREDGYVCHFRGDHIGHCNTLKETRAFLAGFKASENP